jgi:DNA-binding LacI/PurR family transcriptional regulator
MNTKETSADKTKYRLAEAAKKCMAASGTDDISIVGFDDISLAQLVTPPLTTIHQDMNLKGRLAVDFMLQLLDGKPLDTRDISLPTRLIERDSVRAL